MLGASPESRLCRDYQSVGLPPQRSYTSLVGLCDPRAVSPARAMPGQPHPSLRGHRVHREVGLVRTAELHHPTAPARVCDEQPTGMAAAAGRRGGLGESSVPGQ